MHQRNFALNIRRDWTKPPNVVTMVRMLLAFPVAFFALIPDTLGWIGFGCYVLAVSTDWVDGWLAKRNDGRWKTELGKFLDPLADKVINVTALVTVAVRSDNHNVTTLVIAAMAAIVIREVIVFWAKSRQPLASATEAGRFAMVALVVAVALLVMPVGLPFLLLFGTTVFGLGASYAAGWAYIRAHA